VRKIICVAVLMPPCLLAAACSNSATLSSGSSTASSTAPKTRTEIIKGSTTNTSIDTVIVPVTAAGLFRASGSINVSARSRAGTATFRFTNGDLDVHSSGVKGSFSVKASTCAEEQVREGYYTVTGGTGSYEGAIGHGTFELTGTGTAARGKGGKCNTSGSAKPVKGLVAIVLQGPITLAR
jgi:hypothetical protein